MESTYPMIFSCSGYLKKQIFLHKRSYCIMDDDDFWFCQLGIINLAVCEDFEAIENGSVPCLSSNNQCNSFVTIFVNDSLHQINALFCHDNNDVLNPINSVKKKKGQCLVTYIVLLYSYGACYIAVFCNGSLIN